MKHELVLIPNHELLQPCSFFLASTDLLKKKKQSGRRRMLHKVCPARKLTWNPDTNSEINSGVQVFFHDTNIDVISGDLLVIQLEQISN